MKFLIIGLILIITPQLAFSETVKYQINKSEKQWQQELTAQEYHILREKGTERSGTGDLLHNHKTGTYICAACQNELFNSETKFESGTGWPSFYQPLAQTSIEESVDSSLFVTRTEIVCQRCGSHLGHVFNDGPEPTGLRYCINSASLDFVEKE